MGVLKGLDPIDYKRQFLELLSLFKTIYSLFQRSHINLSNLFFYLKFIDEDDDDDDDDEEDLIGDGVIEARASRDRQARESKSKKLNQQQQQQIGHPKTNNAEQIVGSVSDNSSSSSISRGKTTGKKNPKVKKNKNSNKSKVSAPVAQS